MSHRILACNAAKVWGWFQSRGGIAVWGSANLSNPGQTWTAPRLTEDGQPMGKQNWQMEDQPRMTITDPAEVVVDVPKEVKRFHVALRRGAQGLSVKCTDASSRRIRKACEKAGDNSWYEFDYATQECVVFVPGESMPLPEYIGQKGGV